MAGDGAARPQERPDRPVSERQPQDIYAFHGWPSHYGINALLYYTYTPAFAWRVANDTTVQDPVGTILLMGGLGRLG